MLPHVGLIEDITGQIIKEAMNEMDLQRGYGDERNLLVFIIHASADKIFVEELVDLLETMGLDATNLFCSSVPGYWIGLSKNIYAELFKLFLT